MFKFLAVESIIIGDNAFNTFLSEIGTNKNVPSCVFLDLEPKNIDEVNIGTYRKLFHPQQLISGKEDSTNNFTLGHCTIVKKILDLYLDRIIRLLISALALKAVGDGTWSLFGSLILERLLVDYGKKIKASLNCLPKSSSFNCSFWAIKLRPFNWLSSWANLLFLLGLITRSLRYLPQNFDIERPI